MHDCQDCEFKGVSLDNLKEHIAENHVFDQLFSFIMDKSTKQTSTASSEKQNLKESQTFLSEYSLDQTSHKDLKEEIHNDEYFEGNIDDQIKEIKGENNETKKDILKNIDPINMNVIKEEIKDKKDGSKKDVMNNIDPTKTTKVGNRRGQFTCDMEGCSFATKTKQTLKMHKENLHLNILKYACSFCDYKNYSSFNIKYHQKSRHSSIQNESLRILRIGCILCQENQEHTKHFISLEGGKRTTKVRNRKRKFKEGKFACMQEGCMYRSNFSQVVKEHYERIHLEMLRYSCNLCPYKAYLKQMVRVHQQNKLCNKEPKRVLRIGCILCEQNVKHKNHFKNPTKLQGKNKCEESGCEFSTHSKITLRRHNESVHLQITKYACNLCEYKSYSKARLESHQNSSIHSSSDQLKILRIGCTLCDQNILHEKHTNSNLTSPKKKRRPKNQSQDLGPVPDIDKLYESAEKQENGKFKCPICDSVGLRCRSELLFHIDQKHLDRKRYMCGKCDYKHYVRTVVLKHFVSCHPEEESEIKVINCKECETNHNQHEHDYEIVRIEKKEEGVKASKSTDRGNLECNECEYGKFVNKTDRLKHYKANHPGKKIFNCSFCKYDTNYLPNLNSHINSQHKKKEEGVKASKSTDRGNLECNECEYGKFVNKTDRLKHYKANHPGKKIFNCSFCKYDTNYLPNLNSHINSQHKKKEKNCEMCSYKTTSNVLFHKHRRSEHGFYQRNSKHNIKSNGQSHLCQKCGYSTYSKDEFKKHENLSNCTIVSSTKKQYGRHDRIVSSNSFSEIKKYKCNKCNYSTDYPSNVRVHVQTVHVHEQQAETSVTLKLNCDKCKMQLDSVNSLKNHKQVQHGEGLKFRCKRCEFETFNADDLKSHLSTLKH